VRKGLSSTRIWAAPLVLAVVSAVGLVSALLADGVADVLAWLSLGLPVFAVGWYILPRAQRGRRAAEAE
jgi:hypothetical protein